MATKVEYTCWKCDTKKKVPEGAQKPFCCGKVMKATPMVCTKAASAEYARESDDDEPCEEGS